MNKFNKENIQAGDWVRPKSGKPPFMRVRRVGGRSGNKVFCSELGIAHYANCFKKATPSEARKATAAEKKTHTARRKKALTCFGAPGGLD